MIEKLTAMRLLGMAEALNAQEQDPTARDLSFLERFGLLVDQQWSWRENQALSRRLKNAKLRTPNACVEEIDYRTARGLDKSAIRSLTQHSTWVGTHENIFVLGPTGVGKSFVACALAQKACRDGYAALYTRAQSLFRNLAMARADGSLRGLRRGLAALMSWSSTTGPRLHCPSPSAATSGRSAKIAIKCAQPSLRRNCRFHAGKSRSAIPHWLTASSTGWSTMRIGSRCAVIRCVRVEVKRMDRTHSLQGGSASLSIVIRVARIQNTSSPNAYGQLLV